MLPPGLTQRRRRALPVDRAANFVSGITKRRNSTAVVMDRTARTRARGDDPAARCRTITRSGGPHVRLTVGAADLPHQRPLFPLPRASFSRTTCKRVPQRVSGAQQVSGPIETLTALKEEFPGDASAGFRQATGRCESSVGSSSRGARLSRRRQELLPANIPQFPQDTGSPSVRDR